MIAWFVLEDGQALARDYYSTSNSAPSEDQSSDVYLDEAFPPYLDQERG